MVKAVTFQLDLEQADIILTDMVASLVDASALAIQERAQSMVDGRSSNPPTIKVSSAVGTIRKGKRYIATVSAEGSNAHELYVGHEVLVKSIDAGRV